KTESAVTRATADLSLRASSPMLPTERTAGRITLGHSVTAPVDDWAVSGSYRLATAYTTPVSSNEPSPGSGYRLVGALDAGWGHAWSERTSTRLGVSTTSASYSEPNTGVDYRDANVLASVSHVLNETDAASAQLQSGRFSTASGDSTSKTVSVSLSWRRAW